MNQIGDLAWMKKVVLIMIISFGSTLQAEEHNDNDTIVAQETEDLLPEISYIHVPGEIYHTVMALQCIKALKSMKIMPPTNPAEMDAIMPSQRCDERCEPKDTCSKKPLFCGSWNFDIHGGFAPIVWGSPGEVDLVACAPCGTNPIVHLACHLPKFICLYKLPWIIGGKLGYAVCENVECNIEFNYLQAKRKCNAGITLNVSDLPDKKFTIDVGEYRLFDAYFGSRYYFDRIWCNRLSFYLGGKVGLTHHYKTCGAFNAHDIVCAPISGTCVPGSRPFLINTFFTSNNQVSIGLVTGLDVCFCNGWSAFVTGEAIVSCGSRTRTAITFAQPTAASLCETNLIVGGIGTELRFPVTCGFKCTF